MSETSAQAPAADAATSPSVDAPDPLVGRVPALAGVASMSSRGEQVYFPPAQRWVEVARALRDAGFVTCTDLCGVDYLGYLDRPLPEGMPAERFEVVLSLLSHAERRRVRLRLLLPEHRPVAPTLFYVYPGSENMEREAYDMFGIVFEGHPDLTRILMPQDWEGHPLRKDYSVGRVPVQFKEAPGPR